MEFATDKEYERFLQLVPKVEEAFIAGGIQIIKYWFEVSQEQQTRRFEDQDPRKVWEPSPMDLESHRRWYDYSRARDAMFAATDTKISPWYVISGGRQAPCSPELHRAPPGPGALRAGRAKKLKLPDRQKSHGYVEPDYPWRFVPKRY